RFVIGAEAKHCNMNRYEDEQSDTGDNHGAGGRTQFAWAALRCIYIVSVFPRAAIVQIHANAGHRMEKKYGSQAETYDIKKRLQPVQLKGVKIEHPAAIGNKEKQVCT